LGVVDLDWSLNSADVGGLCVDGDGVVIDYLSGIRTLIFLILGDYYGYWIVEVVEESSWWTLFFFGFVLTRLLLFVYLRLGLVLGLIFACGFFFVFARIIFATETIKNLY
jgi:hypothetical protein